LNVLPTDSIKTLHLEKHGGHVRAGDRSHRWLRDRIGSAFEEIAQRPGTASASS
jgi:hypothetical protein